MKKTDSSFETFELMMKYKVYPSYVQAFNLFRVIRDNNDVDRAIKYWNLLKDNNYRHLYDDSYINIILNIFKRTSRYDKAIAFCEEILKEGKYRPNKDNNASISSIISIHGSIGDYMGAVKYFDYYLNASNENKPDLVLFNSLIYAHANSRNIDGALYYYQIMLNDYNIKPDIVTYTSIMKGYEICGDTKNINYMFNTMINSGVQINIQTMNTIIRAFAKTGEVSEALRYFDMLHDYDLKPNSYTLSAIISAHAKAKDKEGVAKYFLMMYEVYNLQPHISMINGILMAWIGYGGNFTFEDIDEILKFLDIFNLKKDSHIYYQLLLACKIKNDETRAFAIFDEILSRSDIGTPPDILCNAMVSIIGHNTFLDKYEDKLKSK